MFGRALLKHGRGFRGWAAGAMILTVTCLGGPASAQMRSAAPGKIAVAEAPAEPIPGMMPSDTGVVQAGCSTCSGGLLGGNGGDMSTIGSGGCGDCCIPGRTFCCDCCGSDSCIGRMACGLYQCICCPDPCYDPKWNALADSAFFADAPRPVTQMRLRWDTNFDWQFPDRGEYLMARFHTSPNQLEPGGPCAKHGIGKGSDCIAKKTDVDELSLYTEAAKDRLGVFVEMPYLHLDPQTAVISLDHPCCPQSGFGDVNVGTKTLLLDCELLQLSFQFKTFIPSGNFSKGLGTGHVSLEPALLFAVKLTPDTYFQGETAYWIPIGGDDLYQSNVFHAHLSLNHRLWTITNGVFLVGTAEINEWSFITGAYTGPDFLGVNPSDGSRAPASISATACMVSVGPGVRLFVCDKVDIGVGTAFSVTGNHLAEETIRAELRWRF